jgi:hypothetical protein
MINLKKNDKLIIIIAVVVIVIAAIGIAAYTPPDDEGNNTGGVDGEKLYNVIWKTHTKTVTIDEVCFAGKNTPFTTEIDIDHENILTVTVEVSWTDDYTHGILMTKGEDTLTAQVDFSSEIWESIGNGTKEFMKNVNSLPSDTTVMADNMNDALEKLKEEGYGSDDSLMITVDISVQLGERIIRPLIYFRDKGNAFDLMVTYEYYEASLEEDIKNTGENNDNSDDFDEAGYIPPFMYTLINTGCGRFV